MATLEVPNEGLKLVCISGYFPNGDPIWRQAGVVIVNKNGKVNIIVDKTFNPAGVVGDDEKSGVMLTAVPYSAEELRRKGDFNKAVPLSPSFVPTLTPKPEIKPYKEAKSSSWNDMDDDIPF